jgi:TIR domain
MAVFQLSRPKRMPFLCHASDDKAHVREVYHRLRTGEGFEPWLDEEDLLPGQE